MKIPNEYLATVVLSQEDKNRVRNLCDIYINNINLKDCFADLIDNKICKEDNFNADTVRIILREAFSNENSANLRNVFLCIAKNLYFCTEEELKIAHIIM